MTDVINSVFILGGSVVLFINVYKLYQDKSVKGVSLIPAVFFGAWGFWNIYWFHHLQQPMSFYGSFLMLAANLWWTGLALYYRSKERKRWRL